jgi:hypothetical protein
MFTQFRDLLQEKETSQAPVAHACNPSYLGSRDQEDLGLKSDWANSSQNPISKKKKNLQKKVLVE